MAAQPATKGVAILVPESYLICQKGRMVSCVDLDHPSRTDREAVGGSLLSPWNKNVLIVLSRPDDALSTLWCITKHLEKRDAVSRG
jgi:hypothetical protein